MINFPELELKWLKYWRDNNIFAKSLSKSAPQGNFVFFEGPPTANGKPGIHHVLARAFKDLIPRYKTMRGFRVARKAGWDTQGLPVELQVEKALGFSGKPDIEKYGVERFNQKCKESVWQYKEEWERLTERMGYWLDMSNPYITYERSYIESLWWIFKQVHKSGLLYQDYKVLPHCPRCATALSSHEVALGYKSIPDKAVYVKFKLKNYEKTYILSWTTTPWTLPGNVALAVGKDIMYVKVKFTDEFFIIAQDRLSEVFNNKQYEVMENITGKDLIGLQYEPLFDIKPLQNEKSHRIYTADFVTTTDGTGVVHTAVMYGEDDFNLGNEVGLPKYHTVDENGNFTADVPWWQGKFVKDPKVEQGIVDELKQRDLLLQEEIYTHDYPFCWRCSTPLLYYAKPSWFIKMSELRDNLKSANESINWYPGHIKYGRFGEWLEGVKDWAVSRERYWGTPLPIWRCHNCKNKNEVVIGSVSELAEVSGQKLDKDFDPHRPFIDQITWQCQQCGDGQMKRVPEVADCWFDSGSMPFAQWGYPHVPDSKDMLANNYPADFIAEAIDQTRGWFYTLLAIATLLRQSGAIKNIPPYRNVICLGHINDKDGQKMSKSKGNIVDPWEVMNKWGADALRWHLYTSNQPGDPKNFDTTDVDQVVKKTLLILMNVVTFYELYKKTDVAVEQEPSTGQVMDKWILALLQQLINEITNHLDKYEVTEAGRKISGFVTDLSTWYVRRSRDRFKEEGEDKQAALATLNYVLVNLAKLMAPFTPFISDEVYRRVGGKEESVHLAVWPKEHPLNEAKEILLKEMNDARAIVEVVLALRSKVGYKVRQPLERLTVWLGSESWKPKNDIIPVILNEVNVLNWSYPSNESEIKEIFTRDDFEKIDLPVGKSWGKRTAEVFVSTKISEQLKTMGLVREFTRQVNALRKELKLTINDKVKLVIEAPGNLQKALLERLPEVKRAVIAAEIEFSSKPQDHQLYLSDFYITLNITKL